MIMLTSLSSEGVLLEPQSWRHIVQVRWSSTPSTELIVQEMGQWESLMELSAGKVVAAACEEALGMWSRRYLKRAPLKVAGEQRFHILASASDQSALSALFSPH